MRRVDQRLRSSVGAVAVSAIAACGPVVADGGALRDFAIERQLQRIELFEGRVR